MLLDRKYSESTADFKESYFPCFILRMLWSCRDLARPELVSLVISEHVHRSWKNFSIFQELLVSNHTHFSQSLKLSMKLESTKIDGDRNRGRRANSSEVAFTTERQKFFLCKELHLGRTQLLFLPLRNI